MPEQRGDGLEAHAPVDRLGGERVTQLVGMQVTEARPSPGPVHHAGDDVAGERSSAVGEQQPEVAVVMACPPGVEQREKRRVQRHVAVVVELPDRDPQPPAVSDLHHGVTLERTQLTHAHPGAHEQLEGEPTQRIGLRRHRPGEAGGVAVVQELGSGSSGLGRSLAKIGHRGGASSQSHSIMRSKKIRSIQSRIRRVLALRGFPFSVSEPRDGP